MSGRSCETKRQEGRRRVQWSIILCRCSGWRKASNNSESKRLELYITLEKKRLEPVIRNLLELELSKYL